MCLKYVHKPVRQQKVMAAYPMECLLKVHCRRALAPDCRTARFASFTDHHVACANSIALIFIRFETHFQHVAQVESAPTHVKIPQVGPEITPVFCLVQHLAKHAVGNSSKWDPTP